VPCKFPVCLPLSFARRLLFTFVTSDACKMSGPLPQSYPLVLAALFVTTVAHNVYMKSRMALARKRMGIPYYVQQAASEEEGDTGNLFNRLQASEMAVSKLHVCARPPFRKEYRFSRAIAGGIQECP
jgi:hypothetical protein